MKGTEPKKNPTTVRLSRSDEAFLEKAVEATGIPAAEIMRRSLRLLSRETLNHKGYGFLIDLAA